MNNFCSRIHLFRPQSLAVQPPLWEQGHLASQTSLNFRDMLTTTYTQIPDTIPDFQQDDRAVLPLEPRNMSLDNIGRAANQDAEGSLIKIRHARQQQESKILEWQHLTPTKVHSPRKRKLIKKLMARAECQSPLSKASQPASATKPPPSKWKTRKVAGPSQQNAGKDMSEQAKNSVYLHQREGCGQTSLYGGEQQENQSSLDLSAFDTIRIQCEDDLEVPRIGSWNDQFEADSDYLGLQKLMF